MNIDELIETSTRSIASTGKSGPIQIPEQWTQGRTAFGGLSACLLLAASNELISKDIALHSVYTSFIGPLMANMPFDIEVLILREGKNVVQVLSKAYQNGQVAVLQQSCFGVKRESKIAVDHIPSLSMSPPDKPLFTRDHHKKLPDFIQFFDFHIHNGGEPFSGSTASHTHGWMRFKEPPKTITLPHIVCLTDVWPPTVAQQLQNVAPLSTMNWYMEFIDPNVPCHPADWLAYQCDASYAKGGYAYTDAYIWNCSGEIIAKSHQTIAVFG